jgi:hypothetical protein
LTRAAALALALSSFVPVGCERATDPSPASASAPPPAVTPRAPAPSFPPRPAGAPVAVDGGWPAAFEAARAALFDRTVDAQVASCLAAGSCLGLSPVSPTSLGAGEVQRTAVGGDRSTLLIGGDAEVLVEPDRSAAALAALEAMAGAIAGAGPRARVLAQSDLWERFDALGAVTPPPDRVATHAALRRALARAVRDLALPTADLATLTGNMPAVEAAHPALLQGLATGAGWVELRARSQDHAGTPWLADTRHAERAGHRQSFRVLVHAPPSGDTPQAGVAERGSSLPAGTVLALVGSPIALSDAGAPVPVSQLVTVIELRTIAAALPATLADLAYEVLEGKRTLLAQPVPPGGGLERLPGDAPMPSGATCAPQSASILPLRATCITCHGLTGGAVTGPMRHGGLELFEEKDPTAAGREVARLAAGGESLRALVAALGP